MANDTGRFDEDELRDSLAETVTPLESVDPDAEAGDLDAIGESIGDADVIGLGEASHGTREFFRFKHRLFRHLVDAHGVRMLGFEANGAAFLDVNDYVLGGDGTAAAALERDCIHPPYRAESIVELVEWIRRFNENRPRSEMVRVHGIDIQYSTVAAAKLEAYFETVDPAAISDVRVALQRLAEDGIPDPSDDEALDRHLAAREAVVTAIQDALCEHEERYVAASSRTAYERASRLVWMLEQGRKQFGAIAAGRADTGANVRIRDSAMAAQVQWLLRHEPPDRIALWGHNAHLARDAFGGGRTRHERDIPSLGTNLARLTAIDYYALGLLLGGGSVGAVFVPDGEYRAYDIGEPPEGSVPDVFGRIDAPAFFLDVAALPPNSVLAEWFDSEPLQYDVEGGYRESPINLVESNLRRQFDGLVFIEETTAEEW